MNKENQQATVGEKSFASTAQVVDLLSLIAKWFLAPAVSVDFDHAVATEVDSSSRRATAKRAAVVRKIQMHFI